MNDGDSDYLRDLIYDLQSDVRELCVILERLSLENQLLRNDLETIKNEGCWRFIENKNHSHKEKLNEEL